MTNKQKKPVVKSETVDVLNTDISEDINESELSIADEETSDAASTASPDKAHFPIVGIGASAGGLAAFEAFFSGMPADINPNMAFVLVQHLAPDHKSILCDLIRRYTRMQVSEVTDGVLVQPNCAYIIPPGRDMAFLNGTLQLLEPTLPRGQRLPIDFFFRSLAQDQHERAICIVLSGTGSDGTLGIRAIKGEGGMVMAQNVESTEYDGMPRSAIATGLVDYILPPAEMPAHLIAYAAHAYGSGTLQQTPPQRPVEDVLKKVFILLRSQTGHDFSQYKPNTIKRRIERRMAVHQITDLWGYVRFLQQTPTEVEALFRDLLIGVTNFFRDPPAFAELETKVIPRLFTEKQAGTAIRVWTCGCSTGEEAYSIAILLQEQMERLKRNFKLQLFATDIDSQAIAHARAGLYPASIAADISPERLARFFTMEADGSAYRINKAIRDLLVFSEQDVIKDPPFSKLDMITCRNLMIYMGSELQKKLIPLFHYSLNPGGVLFLGTSETVGEFVHLFTTLDRQAKLYQCRENYPMSQRLPLGRFIPPMTDELATRRHNGQVAGGNKVSLRETAERILLERYAPASILVSERGEILYIHGSTGRYLQMAAGEPALNILKMAREGLKRELTTALHGAVKNKQTIERSGLRVKTNGGFSTVKLTVLPVPTLPASVTDQNLYLVVLEEPLFPAEGLPSPTIPLVPIEITTDVPPDEDALVTALRQELHAKEEYLKSANEELETSNEELKSSNEEMQSINEELQSTNEELETSKEELQSVNEELATVNTELQTKVFDLSRANNDMNNLLAGTGVGTIFVDFQMLIQRFTPAVTQIINLILSDVGRPVGHIVSNLINYSSLVEDIRLVLDTLIPKEVEVQTKGGAWFLLRIRPYRTLENVIEGAVITFFDICEIKRTREALRKANDQLHLSVVVRDAVDAVVMQNMEGLILGWNPAAVRMYGWSESEALQMNVRDLMSEDRCATECDRVRRMSRTEALEPYRTQRITKSGSSVEIWLTATALSNEAGAVYAIATTERAIRIG